MSRCVFCIASGVLAVEKNVHCEYGVEAELGRVLPLFGVVDHCYFRSVVINYVLCRTRNTESWCRYVVSSETGQCMRKVF